MGDGIATMLSGSSGGTGMTTYAENMGVMAVTRIYSTLVFVVAAVDRDPARLLAEIRRVHRTIPGPVLGGLSIVVFGLIAATAGRIWVENRVDFSNPRNLITVAVALVLGAGNFKLTLGGFTLDGIGTATFGAIILYHLLNMATGRTSRQRADVARATSSFSASGTALFEPALSHRRGLPFCIRRSALDRQSAERLFLNERMSAHELPNRNRPCRRRCRTSSPATRPR